MKKALKLFVIGMLFCNPVFASGDLQIKVEDHQVIVELQNLSEGSSIIFKDEKGEVLFKDHPIPGKVYRKNFNLEIVPEGNYYLDLDSESKIFTTVITKRKDGLHILNDLLEMTFKPKFLVRGKQVKLYLSNPEKEKYFISIYNKKGVLLESLNEDNNAIRKTLDFSYMPAGEYTIRLKSGKNRFENRIIIL